MIITKPLQPDRPDPADPFDEMRRRSEEFAYAELAAGCASCGEPIDAYPVVAWVFTGRNVVIALHPSCARDVGASLTFDGTLAESGHVARNFLSDAGST